MKLNFVDAFVAVLAFIAIMLTIAAFFAVDGPSSEVQDFKITEIPSAPQARPAFPAQRDDSI